ncbi:glucose-1-phosphate thymidylyltransferase [Spirilliplanes yamanashiensis]|uniref:Glucose-1-phosphate thymidylyltransferase n=1 Tax=Spirilliplanes yamanashiensis TaxID=42233 RepID=A0A8J3YE13_9ACTN|nr:glucose-1-phosphate thymidylyltransferase [Spirilliplanes yamanashiensis]MDP9816476.1 glucose-1-phosphate thymidylyltransferase [Spirilliplanes yamanashiensis]GIJ06002.1 glucose-1-phosphate thymidylyltransferase [Spirilliplanes yamanashiensis]
MKALVLAGGRGTRLRPLTNTSAKQLFPVANKPVLFYGLEAIRDAGITEVGIIVGDTGAEVRRVVGDGAEFGLRITYIQQEAPLGLAHCVLIARDFLGDDDFVMYLGDNFLIGGIQELVAAFEQGHYDAQILLTPVDDPRSYGVAQLGRSGEIVGLEEKPEVPESDLAIVGVYMFTPAVHDAVRAISPSARGELEITDAVQWLIDSGHHVHSHLITGYWKDTGRVEDMLECNRIVLESIETQVHGTVDDRTQITGRVVIEAGAVVEASVLRGPIVVGADTKIVGSYLGPFTSIGGGCTVEDAEIEYSIVMNASTVRGVSRIEASLIGKGVEVTPAPSTPRTHQLVIGDHSTVRLRS